MSIRYIVKKKGIFGTLYVDTRNYKAYPSTTNDKEKAYQFHSLKDAQKVSEQIFGSQIIELNVTDELNDSKINDDLIRCESCQYFKDGICNLIHLKRNEDDYCSRAVLK